MKKNRVKMLGIILSIATIACLNACGGNKVEETTTLETETTTEAETTTVAETTTEVVRSTEEEVPPMPTEAHTYEYEVFDDGEDHELIFYIDEPNNKTYKNTFKNTDSFKGWGVERISFPVNGSILQAEPIKLDITLRDGGSRPNYDWEQAAVYDNSSWYPGSLSLFTYYDFLQIWRASTDGYTIDYNAPDPTAIFNAYYNFYDKDEYEVVKPNEINVIDEGNGVIGYKFLIHKSNEWVTKEETSGAYGYMYVRADSINDFVQCIVCGNRYDPQGPEYVEYSLFRSAKFTNLDDISEGEICTD